MRTILLIVAGLWLAVGCANQPSQNTPPTGAPTSTPTTFTSRDLNITLQYPSSWQPSQDPTETLYSGGTGFFQVAATSAAATADSVCTQELQANQSKQPIFGSKPTREDLQIDGQPACLILPSDDQPTYHPALALLVVQYPVTIRAHSQLSLWADKDHIRAIAASLKFIR